MSRFQIVVGLFFCLTLALGIGFHGQASAEKKTDITDQVTAPDSELEPLAAKKCSFNSDCKYGKCVKGRCGGCSFNSDCKGWGKCSKGQCGACSFSSECKGFGSCSGGRCTKSPY